MDFLCFPWISHKLSQVPRDQPRLIRLSALHLLIAAVALAAQPQVGVAATALGSMKIKDGYKMVCRTHIIMTFVINIIMTLNIKG